MVCPECGARLTSSDQFCPGCGARIIRKKRCPACGEMLREGTRFCPSCGEGIPEDFFTRKTASGSASKRKAEPVPPSKKVTHREEAPKRRRGPEEDWDDEDDDDDEEGVDVLTIMTVVVGCVLLVIVAVLGFNLFQRYMPKNYERAAAEQEESEEEEESGEEDGEEEQRLEVQELSVGGVSDEAAGGSIQGTLLISSDVRIRSTPTTDDSSNIIRTAKEGESYSYTDVVEGGNWYQILLSEDGSDYGYVYGEYVEVQ